MFTLRKTFLIVTLSTIAITGGALSCVLLYQYIKQQKMTYSTGTIQAIIQTSSQEGLNYTHLQTALLAEVLDLSCDRPTKLSQFDLNDAKKRLLDTHVIKTAKLKKMKPNLLFIDYTTRTPFVSVKDHLNTAMDAEGFFFPIAPFFPPRHLQEICLGNVELSWGEKIKSEHLLLIQEIFALLGTDKIQSMDLSQVDAQSAGKREIIIVLNEGSILRLSKKNYSKQLSNYLYLNNSFLKEKSPKVIDLRIPDVAYLK